jgi:DHA2 family multidrug resistance protein-like MFS transporter
MTASVGPGLVGRERAMAIAAVLGAMVLAVLDAAIVNVALPTMARSLQVTPAAAVGIVTAYQAALVMGLLPCAALGDKLGHRRVFTAGVVLFTLASGGCAVSGSLPALLAARFGQGLGAAAVMALGIALLRRVVPPRELGAAIGWNALAVALSSAAGPALGAAVLSFAGWPWLFALNLPFGVAVLFATRALPDSPGTGRSLDRFSVTLHAVAFASLVVGAEMLATAPGRAGGLLLMAMMSGTVLIRRELRRDVPLVPFDLLRAVSFRRSVLASVCCFAGVTLALLALPFHLQHQLGRSALATGLLMMPWPLTVAVAAPLAGHLASRLPTAWLCGAGASLLCGGLAIASLLPVHGGAGPLVWTTVACGLGFGLFQVPNNRNMFLSTPAERSGAAGGMQGTARLVGQTIGGIGMSLLFALAPTGSAPRIGLGLAAGLALAAAEISLARTEPTPASDPSPCTPPGRSRAATGAPCRHRAAGATAARR